MRLSPRLKAGIMALPGFVLINAVLAAPSRTFTLDTPVRLAAEALLLAGLMLLTAALKPRWSRRMSALFASVLLIVALLKAGNIAQHYSLDRPLNLALDWVLLRPVFDMSAGMFGLPLALAGCLAVALLLMGIWWLLAKSFRTIAAVAYLHRPRRAAIAGSLLAAAGLALAWSIWPGWTSGSFTGIANRLLVEQGQRAVRTVRQQAAFRQELMADSLDADETTLSGLAQTDVVLVFVESYGATALRDQRFSPLIGARLSEIDASLADAGLVAASGWLNSPTVGGQSWLAHASVLSGLTIDNNAKYHALTRSGRATLIDLFEQGGYRSVAVMPAIASPWPEGKALGYDQIYDASNLGYEASPFNWVTMPDQFVLSTFERLERALPPTERKPLFAEIALISSHAPWTPVAELLDWPSIDEAGMVFDAMAQRGPTPAEVWSDPDSIRWHYAMALDYSLEVLGDYARRFAGTDTLLIIMGDHQPAPVVTGSGAGSLVPIHVIAGVPRLLRPFRLAGYSPGMMPAPEAAQLPMAALRDIVAMGY